MNLNKNILVVTAIAAILAASALACALPKHTFGQQFCVSKNGEIFNGRCPPSCDPPKQSTGVEVSTHIATGGNGTCASGGAGGAGGEGGQGGKNVAEDNEKAKIDQDANGGNSNGSHGGNAKGGNART